MARGDEIAARPTHEQRMVSGTIAALKLSRCRQCHEILIETLIFAGDRGQHQELIGPIAVSYRFSAKAINRPKGGDAVLEGSLQEPLTLIHEAHPSNKRV